MEQMELDQRVLAGGLWLDMMAPGWRDVVDWSVLDITSNRRCVLGQVFDGAGPKWQNGFSYALRTFWPVGPDNSGALVALGFLCASASRDGDPHCECKALGAAWLRLWGPDA